MSYKTNAEIKEIQEKHPELRCLISLTGFHQFKVIPFSQDKEVITVCERCLSVRKLDLTNIVN